MASFENNWVSLLSQKITQEFCDEITVNGWAMLDDVLGEKGLLLVEEINLLSSMENGFSEHKFQFGHSRPGEEPKIFRKPHIFELDMHDKRVSSLPIPQFKDLYHSKAIPMAFSACLPNMELIDDETTLKIQRNAGNGGCFPYHYDNPGPPNRRALTCLFYLNANWQEGDGGEVELQPFLKEKVVISPLFGRLVVFESDKMLHRVLPSRVERICFTLWIDGKNVNGVNDVNLKAKHIDMNNEVSVQEKAAFMRKSPLQRVISRVVYSQEYEISLKQCMLEANPLTKSDLYAGRMMIAEHEAYIGSLRSNPQLNLFMDALIEYNQAET